MPTWVWAILLAFEAVGLFGQWVIGTGRWWGWMIVLLHSVPWFVSHLVFGSYVAAMMAPLWWSVNGYNMMRWKRKRHRLS
jgi:hypothetical protein